MTIETAQAGNWVAETFTNVDDYLALGGTSGGYVRFRDAFKNGDTVFYSAVDDDNNREAGVATFQDGRLVGRNVTAVLRNGVYEEGESLSPVTFLGTNRIVSGTFNQYAFEKLWSHIYDEDNPHDNPFGVPEAPADGKQYGRRNESWSEIVALGTGAIPDAPVDGNVYGRKNAQWENMGEVGSGTVISDTPPANPSSGDMWFDSTRAEGDLYIYDGDVWFSSNVPSAPGGAPGDGPSGSYDDSKIVADLAAEVADREAGDLDLQGQIDALGSSGGGVFSNVQVITTTMASWPIPATAIKITVVGGGGGSVITSPNSSNGTAGGTTSVERQDGTKLAVATGGGQGYKQQQKINSALGGKGTVGDIKIQGGSGHMSPSSIGATGGSSTHGGGGQGSYAGAGQSQDGRKGGYGAGGGSHSNTVFTSSGAAGGTAIAYLNGLTIGDTLKLTVGAGGDSNGAAGVIICEY